MIDDGAWLAMKDQLTTVAALPLPDARPGTQPHPPADDFGRAHLLLALDYKQLPPATSRPPLIAADPEVLERFEFRVLRENRRLTSSEDPARQASLEQFHKTLEDIAMSEHTPAVEEFFVASYVRGAAVTQDSVGFEKSTACFTKRRYRDGWNRRVLQRSAAKYGRALRVKAVFGTRGADKQWIRESAAAEIRRSVRSQSLVTLRLAGQWSEDAPVAPAMRPHFMRAMLVANIDVPNGFANGASGRIVHWGPEHVSGIGEKGHSLLANVPGVQVRFHHEDSLQSGKSYYLPKVDFIDLNPRAETVPTARGKPNMLQLQIQPGYAVTIHKIQALTIKHDVNGCLEGVFAHGQIYVLASRVTDPEHFHAVGLPPLDLLEPVARAWKAAGLDVDACFQKAASVTKEWVYTARADGGDPCTGIASRLHPKYEKERRVAIHLKKLKAVLNAQPDAATVLHGLLDWMDRADQAAQRGEPRPPRSREDGTPLFPETAWWLTEMERKKKPDAPPTDENNVLDEEDLTRVAAEAGALPSSSGSDDSEGSEASLPAGPAPKRNRSAAAAAGLQLNLSARAPAAASPACGS